MRQNVAIVASFDAHGDAEDGVERLAMFGFNMQALSIVATGTRTEEQIVGFYSAGDRVRFWGKLGLLWGGFWGLVIGGVLFAEPTAESFEIYGFLVWALVAAVEGALIIGGLSALGAALFSFGRPVGSVLKYGSAAKAGTFLIVLRARAEDAVLAKRILRTSAVALPTPTPVDAAVEPTPLVPARA